MKLNEVVSEDNIIKDSYVKKYLKFEKFEKYKLCYNPIVFFTWNFFRTNFQIENKKLELLNKLKIWFPVFVLSNKIFKCKIFRQYIKNTNEEHGNELYMK